MITYIIEGAHLHIGICLKGNLDVCFGGLLLILGVTAR